MTDLFVEILEGLNIYISTQIILQMLSLLIYSTLLCGVLGDWYHSVQSVVLTKDNYLEHLGQSKHVIVDFFTPWCIYCQYMAGEWNRVYEHYNSQSRFTNHLTIAKINCGDEQQLCQSMQIYQFPTILHYPPASQQPANRFSSHRIYDHFVSWIDQVTEMDKVPQDDNQQPEGSEPDTEPEHKDDHEHDDDHDDDHDHGEADVEIVITQEHQEYDSDAQWIFDVEEEKPKSVEKIEKVLLRLNKKAESNSFDQIEQNLQSMELYLKTHQEENQRSKATIVFGVLGSLVLFLYYIRVLRQKSRWGF